MRKVERQKIQERIDDLQGELDAMDKVKTVEDIAEGGSFRTSESEQPNRSKTSPKRLMHSSICSPSGESRKALTEIREVLEKYNCVLSVWDFEDDSGSVQIISKDAEVNRWK